MENKHYGYCRLIVNYESVNNIVYDANFVLCSISQVEEEIVNFF